MAAESLFFLLMLLFHAVAMGGGSCGLATTDQEKEPKENVGEDCASASVPDSCRSKVEATLRGKKKSRSNLVSGFERRSSTCIANEVHIADIPHVHHT